VDALLPVLQPDGGGGLRVVHGLGADAQDAGVVVVPEWSEDLAAWDAEVPLVVVATVTNGLRTLDLVPDAAPMRALRLRTVWPGE
jgi:hypothetical protein